MQRSTIAALALALAGCAGTTGNAPSDAGPPIAISPATQSELTAYLAKVKATRPGAFAVSKDGLDSFYTWCDDIACMTYNYSIPALRGCRRFSGAECVVLYVRNEPRRAFTRAAEAASGGQHGSQQQQRYEYD